MVSESAAELAVPIFARPKSSSFTPAAVTRMLAGFQIAMRDAFLVRGIERIANLHGVAKRLIERERTVQRSPLDKLHHQIIRADVVNLADVRMIQRGDGFGFPLEALRELRRRKP